MTTTSINPIPGSAVIGWGFDIFKTYSTDSKTEQLFAMPSGTETWEGPSATYRVPDNVVVEYLGVTTGSSDVFESREQLQESFALKANVSGTYGAFSGQFEASYENRSVSDQQYMYAMYQSLHHGWRLSLRDQSAGALASWVTNQDDWKNVPDTFDETTAATFYAFFGKYGTHYVSSAKVGYRLYLCQAVKRSYESNSTTIKSKINLEYQAAFVDTKAECTADWNKVGQDWTNQTITSVESVGGNADLLKAVLPQFQSNYYDIMQDWYASAEVLPVAVDFELRPIWVLFSAAQQIALQEAFESYQYDRVFVESKSDDSSIVVAGTLETPATRPPVDTVGFQISVLDRATFEPVINEYAPMSVVYWNDSIDAYYDRAYSLVAPYRTREQYLVVISAFNMIALWYPRGQFYEYLLATGAGRDLSTWELTGKGNTQNTVGINYALVGVSGRGPGTGSEAVSVGNIPATWGASVDPEFYVAGSVSVSAPAAGLDIVLQHFQKRALNLSLVRTSSTNLLEGAHR